MMSVKKSVVDSLKVLLPDMEEMIELHQEKTWKETGKAQECRSFLEKIIEAAGIPQKIAQIDVFSHEVKVSGKLAAVTTPRAEPE